MGLLPDEKIFELSARELDEPLVSNFREIHEDHKHSEHSPFQPASFDLTAGGFYLPEADPSKDSKKLDTHVLEAGQTVVVVTAEKLNLPNCLAGLCFPPTRISAAGLLITNTGHVDPGYQGWLSFTIINMGKSKYTLRAGDVIATCLFVRLESPAVAGYRSRRGGARSTGPNIKMLSSLSKDFLNIEKRSENAANDAITRLATKYSLYGIIAFVLTLLFTVSAGLIQPVLDMQHRITQIETRLDASLSNSEQ